MGAPQARRLLHQKAQAAAAENQNSYQARALKAAEVLASCAADGVIKVENTLRPTHER